jgi:hypothetical protein
MRMRGVPSGIVSTAAMIAPPPGVGMPLEYRAADRAAGLGDDAGPIRRAGFASFPPGWNGRAIPIFGKTPPAAGQEMETIHATHGADSRTRFAIEVMSPPHDPVE